MRKSFLIATLCAAFCASACGDDDKKSDGESEESLDGDCALISEACHEHDDGTGKPSECHELAHENDTAVCSDELEACETACAEHGH